MRQNHKPAKGFRDIVVAGKVRLFFSNGSSYNVMSRTLERLCNAEVVVLAVEQGWKTNQIQAETNKLFGIFGYRPTLQGCSKEKTFENFHALLAKSKI